jgi:hypothetical protein
MRYLLAVLLLFTVGCAKDFYGNYENPEGNDATGSLLIKLSAPVQNVSVTIDDQLIAENKYTDQILIDNVPAGEHAVNVVASSSNRNDLDKTLTVDITAGKQNEHLVKAPSLSSGYFVQTALMSVGFVAVYYLLGGP